VAGSKGKGSVSAMVESILRAAGLTTGLYTSPHLHDYTERIAINGEPVLREVFARMVEDLRPAVEETRVAIGERSFVTFDLLTALGFMAFRDAGVQAQVIEVGLGGRVDSTNVFEAKDVALITPLSFEHTAVLGDDIAKIAAEKAAIITPGCVAVMSSQPYSEAAAVVRDFAARASARLVEVAEEYRWLVMSHDARGQVLRIEGVGRTIEARVPLLGQFQAENAATAVAAVDALATKFEDLGHRVSDEAIVLGLETVRWPGRLEVLSERPLVIADGAHNADSARRLREALTGYFGAERVTFVIGAGGDKDIAGLAEELAPIAALVIATRSAHPRALDPRSIVEAFERMGTPAEDVDSVPAAIERALAASDEGGVICLAGSLFVAAQAREYFNRARESAGGVHGG
jgi:dihydrofolate synthase/folylpolyglutamate synthase